MLLGMIVMSLKRILRLPVAKPLAGQRLLLQTIIFQDLKDVTMSLMEKEDIALLGGRILMTPLIPIGRMNIVSVGTRHLLSL
jgi:hypothetical protein